MLLETRINNTTTVAIDCETAGGIDKGAAFSHAHPDKILDSTVAIVRAVVEKMGDLAKINAAAPPSSMEVVFGIRTDSNSVVSVARQPDVAQFRVTVRWGSGS